MAEFLHFFKGKLTHCSLTFIALFFLGSVSAQTTDPVENLPTVTTDKEVYEPGENVVLNGIGFMPDEEIILYAVGTTNGTVVNGLTNADSVGNFNYNLLLPLIYEEHYSLTATGTTSNLSANILFQDDINSWDRITPSNSSALTLDSGSSYTFVIRAKGTSNSSVAGVIAVWSTPLGSPTSFTSPATGSDGLASYTHTVSSTSGSYTITATGGGKNITFAINAVVPVGCIAPTISASNIGNINSTTGSCSANVSFGVGTNVILGGTPTPTVTYKIVSTTITSPHNFPFGTTAVTATTNNNGCGTASTTFNVTISDSEFPALVDPTDVTGNNDTGFCYKVVELTAPSATDNCGISAAGVTSSGIPADNKFPVGKTTVTWSVTDIHGNESTQTQDVTISDSEFPALVDPTDVTGNNDTGFCYKVVELTVPSATDNCGISAAGVTSSGIPADNKFPVGKTTVTWSVTDIHGNESTQTQLVEITNTLPNENTVIIAPEGPVQAGAGFDLFANFNDNNLVSATWYFSSDGEINSPIDAEETFVGSISGGGVVSGSFNFDASKTGVYTIKVVVEDACGATAESNYKYGVIYDPDGGFVTGGGWFYSLPGNMPTNPSAEGKANFGFNAKYKTGKNNINEVDGNTEFQFSAGNFNFKSSSHYDMSLVVSGEKKATYRGVGTVNGRGSHKFMVTVIDGDAPGVNSKDKFRIKVWADNSPSIMYDNETGIDDNVDAITDLGGGSIVIHKPKGNSKAQEIVTKGTPIIMQDLMPEILESLAASPNPVVSFSTVRFSVREDANVVLRVYDYSGRMIETLYSGQVKAYQNYDVDFQRRNLMSGIYIVKLTTDKGQSYDKRIIVE